MDPILKDVRFLIHNYESKELNFISIVRSLRSKTTLKDHLPRKKNQSHMPSRKKTLKTPNHHPTPMRWRTKLSTKMTSWHLKNPNQVQPVNRKMVTSRWKEMYRQCLTTLSCLILPRKSMKMKRQTSGSDATRC